MKPLHVLTALLAAGLIATAASLVTLKRSTADLKERLDRLEVRQRESTPAASLEKLDRKVELMQSEVAEAKRAPVPAVAPAPAASSKPVASFSPEELDQIIDRKVEEKVKGKGEDNGFGGKKRPLGEVAKEMKVDPAVEVKMAEFANDGKQKVFDLLKLPRADGTNLVDDIIAAMQSGEKAKENANAAFMRIFKEHVPGSQETYFAAAIRISEDISRNFETILTPEQVTAFKHTGVGPLDLETGFDPWGEYLKKKQ